MRGEDMRGFREGRGLTQPDFAAMLNEALGRKYDAAKISRWETGSERIPGTVMSYLVKQMATLPTAHGPAIVTAFANQKGGVAKTTSAVNIASRLAMDGYKVLLVDLDPQANATLHLGINHVVREKEGKTMRRVFRQEVELADIIHTDERTGLDLASSSIDVSEVESALNADASGAFMLNQILEDARRTYDFIFLDCPPNLGPLTANGLVASDLVIIPCQTEFFASSGVGLLLRTINNLRSRCRLSVDVLGILPTMYNSSLNQHRATLEEMHVEFGSKFRIFPAVPRATVYGEAAMSGRAALEAMPSAPGAAEYDVLRQAIVEARRKRVEVANAA